MAYGDMINYERKQFEFEKEQLLNYVTRPTISLYKKL